MKKSNILFLLPVILSLIGCEKKCSHDYVSSVSIFPTENNDGKMIFTCNLCKDQYEEVIPLLNETNYHLNITDPTCIKEGCKTYSNDIYGQYGVSIPTIQHTTLEGRCDMCGKLINNLHFETSTIVNTKLSGGYPRMYKLQNENIIFGADDGTIRTNISETGGYSFTKTAFASFHPLSKCANVDFFQLDNGDLLCTYRAIGPGYHRAIYTSISHDSGETWEEYNTVIDNYNMGYSEDEIKKALSNGYDVGFYEPFVEKMGNKIVVVYADDFSPMIEKVYDTPAECYSCQYLMAAELVNGEWVNHRIIMNGASKKSPTGSNIPLRTSRDGMPVYGTLKDGTVVMVFEGTYRNTKEFDEVQFEILMSYSKDNGQTWSNPVEIYTPTGNFTKASAPFIVITKDDRLVVSFQTNEDCFGTEINYKGENANQDAKSLMKCMISDGTKVEEITADNFFEAQNVFNLLPGKTSIWNGMMIDEDTIYCISGVGTVKFNTSEVPLLAKGELE